jgi:hypothetical protein
MTDVHNMTSPSEEVDCELDDGRAFSPEGEELFTAYFLPTVGRIVQVRQFKSRLSAVTPARRRLITPETVEVPYVSRRPAKARIKLLCYNIHNDLRIAGTLTMSEWPEGPLKHLQLYVDRLYTFRKERFAWTAVAEIGDLGHPHVHICLPRDFKIEDLQDRWEQSSIADFQVLENHKDVLAWSLYIAKDFELKEHERPTYRRYHSAHGYQPKPVKLKGLTKDQILQIAQEQAALHGSELNEWDGSDAWCPKGYFWTV